MEEPKTLIGLWMKGLIRLKKEGFSEGQIADINAETSHLVELLLQFYDYGDTDLYEVPNKSVEDWFNGILDLKRAGFTFEEISQFMEDIKNAYYYIEHEYDEWDEEEDEDNDYDDYDDGDDEDDEDDEGDDDDFDPKKFFPKR